MTAYFTRDLRLKNQFVFPEWFPYTSGDDKAQLSYWIDFINANPSYIGLMPLKEYSVTGALPNLTATGARIYGCGPSADHDVGTNPGGTIIKAITNTGFNILEVAPVEGASAQRLSGVVLDGITFNGNSKADKCVVFKSMRYSKINIACLEAMVYGCEFNVSSTLGENRSSQDNEIKVFARQTTNAVPAIFMDGDATANWSKNYDGVLEVLHKDATGIVVANADNNTWYARIFRAAGGSATNSIEWRGGATSAQSTRFERYLNLQATVAPIAKGTGTYTVAAQNIFVNPDTENGTPAITVETGCSVYDDRWRETTPTPTPEGGAFTTVSATVRTLYPCAVPAKRVFIAGSVVITAFGTASGYIRVPLPVTQNTSSQGAAFAVKDATNGDAGIGQVAANTAYVDILKYDATTLAGANRTILFSGTVEIA